MRIKKRMNNYQRIRQEANCNIEGITTETIKTDVKKNHAVQQLFFVVLTSCCYNQTTLDDLSA